MSGLDEVVVDAVVAGARRGDSAQRIADRVGVSSRTIVRYRKRLGLAQEKAPDLTDRQVAHAAELLAAGHSYRETARRVGCSQHPLLCRFPNQGHSR